MKEFQKFPKMARLSRECVITEKIDGTNAQIYIEEFKGYPAEDALFQKDGLALWAGSRTRWITPQADNYGFAKWALDHGEELLQLGPGRHFGEWWGAGIQRGYGLSEKRFSLFNVLRWALRGTEPKPIYNPNPFSKEPPKMQQVLPACVGLVPELYRGDFSTVAVVDMLQKLVACGSQAAPGFGKPEGVVVYHIAGNVGFKKTIEKDNEPKSKHT